MKILVLNHQSENEKYEIYDMLLNQEKAIKFREKYAKKIRFYRFGFNINYDDWNLFLDIRENYTNNCLVILENIPVVNEKVFYGDVSASSLMNRYSLYPYYENNVFLGFMEKEREEGKLQSENFVNSFVKNGFKHYVFAYINDYDLCHGHAYLFLNSLLGSEYGSIRYSDNVVYFPDELLTYFLLENGYIYEASHYFGKLNEEEILKNFDFQLSSTFSQKNINDLIDCGVLEEQFQRKLRIDYPVASFIRKCKDK